MQHQSNPQLQTMMNQQQQRDRERLQKLIKTMIARKEESPNHHSSREPFTIDNDASSVMIEYINEIACSILEEAALLAKHRKSQEIDANDINFILVKKLGVVSSSIGVTRPKVTTKHSFRFAGHADDEDDNVSVGSTKSTKSLQDNALISGRVNLNTFNSSSSSSSITSGVPSSSSSAANREKDRRQSTSSSSRGESKEGHQSNAAGMKRSGSSKSLGEGGVDKNINSSSDATTPGGGATKRQGTKRKSLVSTSTAAADGEGGEQESGTAGVVEGEGDGSGGGEKTAAAAARAKKIPKTENASSVTQPNMTDLNNA